jgi:hypothetical protein
MSLLLSDVGELPCRVVRHIRPGVVGVAFDELPDTLRWYLVAKIFAHDYENHGKHVAQAKPIRALGARLLGLRPAGTVVPESDVQDATAAGRVRPALDLPPETSYPRLAQRDAGRRVARISVA